MNTKKILDFILETIEKLKEVSEKVMTLINTPMNNILSAIGIESELLQTILNSILDTINIGTYTIVDMILGLGIPIIIVLAVIKFMDFSK